MPAYNFKDLTGKRFGMLVVKERDLSNTKGKTKWICQCDCGNTVSCYAYNLPRGIVSDCGCTRKIDISNQKFGKLTAIKTTGKSDSSRSVIWECICDCGNIVEVSSRSLRKGLTKSCGCLNRRNLIGDKFGRLTVIEKAKSIKGRAMWLCLCECGNKTTVIGSNLIRGNSLSCGCLTDELNSKRMSTHGKSKTRIYGIWIGMKQRCYNPKVNSYKNYGGKGITVCDEWMGENGFCNFEEWSIKNGYSEDLTIDRIDPNGNYEPSNCRWADKETQMNNMTTNIYLTYNGKKQTISQWSKETGIKSATLNYRHRKGWSDIECIEGKSNNEYLITNK